MRSLRLLAVTSTLVALACGGGGDDDDGNPTGPPGGGATNGSFSVQINGASSSATGTITVQRQQNNTIGFAGSGSAGGTTYGVAVSIVNATGPGPHSLNIFAGGDGSNVTIGTSSGVGYTTGLTGGSGTVTITSLTSTRIVGIFSGTAVPAGSSGANLVLVNGQFDITF